MSTSPDPMQLLAMLARANQSQPQGGQAQGQMPMPAQAGPQQPQQPSMAPQQGNAQPQMPQFQQGRSTMMLPSGTASPAVPGVPMSAQPPRQGGRTSASGIAAIPAAVFGIKQKLHGDKVQKARAIINDWLAMQQNPELQKATQSDPAMAKVLQKKQQDFVKTHDEAVKDPNSAAAQGIQLAYRDQMSQEQQRMGFEEFRAKLAQAQATAGAEQQRAEQERQHARLYEKQAEQEGQVTPAKQAELEQRDRAQAEVTRRTQAVQKEANKRMQMQIDSHLAQTRMTTGAMLKATGMRMDALKASLDQHTGDKILDSVAKEYTNLNSQIKVLNDQSAKLQKDISDHPIQNWWSGEGGEKQSQIMQNSAQVQILQQQLKMVEQKRQVMMQVGALPPDVGNVGTPEEPISVSDEDMQ